MEKMGTENKNSPVDTTNITELPPSIAQRGNFYERLKGFSLTIPLIAVFLFNFYTRLALMSIICAICAYETCHSWMLFVSEKKIVNLSVPDEKKEEYQNQLKELYKNIKELRENNPKNANLLPYLQPFAEKINQQLSTKLYMVIFMLINAITPLISHVSYTYAFSVSSLSIIVLSLIARVDSQPLFTFFFSITFPFSAAAAIHRNIETNGLSFEYLGLVVLTTAVGENAALLGGLLFGSYKPFPLISPKKTIEGFILQILSSGLTVYLFVKYQSSYSIINNLDKELDKIIFFPFTLGLVLGIVGIGGDLFISYMKRSYGIKDMASYIPGWGGLMDRVDGIAPNMFVMWCYICAFKLYQEVSVF